MKKYLILAILSAVFGSAGWFGYRRFSSLSHDEFVPVAITGVQHLGNGYLISRFYVNKYGGDSVGREGGGGSVVCCVLLPLKWRPGLTVEIRWRVEDWTNADYAEIEKGNYASVSEKKMYIAKVPVERYDGLHDLIVHFFPHGRVRAVSTVYSVSSPLHPIPFGPSEGGPIATAGWPINEMFSQAELLKIKSEESNPWK